MKNESLGSVRCTRQAGFTLIEMLLVVVIIGMLATIATVSIPRHLKKARRSKAAADIQSIGIAIQSYYMDEGKYPGSLDVLTSGEEPYLEGGIPNDPWGRPYSYAYPGGHKPFKYDLASMGEDGVASGDDVANWKQDVKEE
jgi:general secretion pathway protein G